MKLFKTIKTPLAIEEFISTFTLAIKDKDITQLKQHFSKDCEFIFDYSKFGEGTHKQSLNETLKAFEKEQLKLSKINNKIISYKEEKGLHIVVLESKDNFESGKLSSMNYEEELSISQKGPIFSILSLSCKFKKIKNR